MPRPLILRRRARKSRAALIDVIVDTPECRPMRPIGEVARPPDDRFPLLFGPTPELVPGILADDAHQVWTRLRDDLRSTSPRSLDDLG